ncbi:MAG: rRNA (uracil1498-N3)-methyltransferase [Actinomycetota bacterium]|nr:rRNA (uracil1498-N3)-methyltransferase [Actinomycetota bacterium]
MVPTARLVAGRVLVDGPEGRHAATVTRLGVGEEVVLVDGRGRRGHGAVAAVRGKDHLEVDVTAVTEEPTPSPWLVVVQALPKGDRGEVAVETLTEVGVDEIVPWAAARCVTRWHDVRGEKALARWRTTAQAAAKQSRRARFPVVAELAGTRDVADRLRRAALGVLLHEEAEHPLATAEPPAAGEVVVVVGPEGGISPEELAVLTGVGATAYRLGPTVLRTSTAGTAAAAALLSRTPRWR